MAEIFEEPECVVEAEDVGEVMSEESLAELEEVAAEVYYYQSEQEIIASSFKSIMPLNMFDSFAGFFSEPTTGFCPQYDVKKAPVEEIIDVSKEMNEETLKEIADKALMGKLKEVDKTQDSESVETESVKTESIETKSVKKEFEFKSENLDIKSGEKSKSESDGFGKTEIKTDKEEKVFEKDDQISETPCKNCLKPCMGCLEKDKQLQELKKYNDEVKFDLNDVKEGYDTLARSIKMIQKESLENDKATNLLKATVMDKQMEINILLDKIASLKKELELIRIETERVDKKLINGVEAALNLKLRTVENELPENIDVTFSPSDTDNESQVIKTVVDKVLDEESDNSDFGTVKTQLENSNSDSEDDGNFLDKFIPKSDKVVNDDSILVVYTMTGTDKLYSDFEYPIQNAKLENVEKVFKLVEIDISEVNNNAFLSKPKKSFVKQQPNNPGKKEWEGNNGHNKRHGNNFKRKGVGFEKKMDKKDFKPKEKLSDVFVAGKNTVAEKDYIFSQKAVDNFNAAKKLKNETNRSTFVEYDKRICYRCNEIGHMAKQCDKKIEKPVFQKPKLKTSKDVKGKTPMVSPVRILKRGESLKSKDKSKSTFEIGESSNTKKISNVYPKMKIFQNQSWVEKPKQSFEEKKMEKELKSESKVFATDVDKLEFELDKLIEEFPPIKEGDLKSKLKPVVPNVIFNIPKVDVSHDIIFGSVPNGLPRSIISKWIMDSGASRHMTGMLAFSMMSNQSTEDMLDLREIREEE
ncbi:uncharacterized protein PFB0765w-like [Helianthus annuus]|uniref:uncharacterized protein PFB0765w-like n=1 Tax=Helianthus annuus TaxID=4232 RepID=UPI000B9011CB|nr:uncharacterized protein PFB0765w-like [Helianthus annuus]